MLADTVMNTVPITVEALQPFHFMKKKSVEL